MRAEQVSMGMSDGGVRIRSVDTTELEHLLDLRMEVLDSVFADDSWDAEQLRAENRRYYENHLGKDHVACIATVGEHEAGCGAICLQSEMPSPDNPSGTCAYLMNVYTREAFRRHGVGAAVVSWLIDQARDRGANKIYLEATEAGRPLYEHVGFRPLDGMMKLGSSSDNAQEDVPHSSAFHEGSGDAQASL